jgi:hypothetical protein
LPRALTLTAAGSMSAADEEVQVGGYRTFGRGHRSVGGQTGFGGDGAPGWEKRAGSVHAKRG